MRDVLQHLAMQGRVAPVAPRRALLEEGLVAVDGGVALALCVCGFGGVVRYGVWWCEPPLALS